MDRFELDRREVCVVGAGCRCDMDALCGPLLLQQWPALSPASWVMASEVESPAQSGASLTRCTE